MQNVVRAYTETGTNASEIHPNRKVQVAILYLKSSTICGHKEALILSINKKYSDGSSLVSVSCDIRILN